MFDVIYTIDKELLSKLDLEIQKKIIDLANENKKQEIPEITNISHIEKYFSIELLDCPYCGYFDLNLYCGEWENISMCIFCGDVSPNIKIDYSLTTAKEFINMLKYLKKKMDSKKDLKSISDNWFTTIKEHAIVIIATGIEIFLRDVYSIMMNIRFVKCNLNLFEKFHKDTKNKFTNIGIANGSFKRDLDIDFKEVVGKDDFSKLILLSAKRNAIVHNSGWIDIHFKESSNLDCHLNDKISISTEEIIEYIKIIEEVVSYINKKFEDEITSYILKKIEMNIDEINIIPLQT